MPKLSCFTPLGLLKLSSKKPIAQLIYEQQMASLGGQFATDPGTHVEASVYARAMGLARAAVLIEHAGNQGDPGRVLEHIPQREREYGVVPGPNDTIADRRRALTAARKIPNGAVLMRLKEAFADLLGSAFVDILPTSATEAVTPLDLGDPPMNLQVPTVPRRFIRILDGMNTGIPGSKTVRYEPLDEREGTVLEEALGFNRALPISRVLVGEMLVIDAEHSDKIERITVTGSGYQQTGSDPENDPIWRTLTATFTKAHEVGASGTTIPYPAWWSSKRHITIVLTSHGALDAETRRKAHELAHKILPSVDTWSIVAESSTPGTIGPFILGTSPLSVTPFGSWP